MPITQERFMTVVIGAKHIINMHRTVKEVIRNTIGQDMSEYNSVLMHSTDENAKQAILKLLNCIRNIRDHFTDLNNSDVDELTGIIIAEEIHFKKAARRNQKARYYQTQTRRDNGIMPRTKEVEIAPPAVMHRSFPLSPQVMNIEDTTEFKQFQEDQRKKYWPSANEREKLPIKQQIAKEREENEHLFGPQNIDDAAKLELELMQKVQATSLSETSPLSIHNEPPQMTGKETALTNVIKGGASYDKSVIKTSVPSLEELNQVPIKSGTDIL